jgi:predicted anti-sigma-YlaC factor YlaD
LNKDQGKLDCSACEQKILGAADPRDVLRDPSVSDHLAACTECKELFDSLGAIKPVLDRYRVREPAEDVIEAVLRLAPQVHSSTPPPERGPVHAGMLRVVLAGLVSLPLVILINALVGWALYEVAASLLPRTIALYCVGLFVVWASMAVSLGYASLPLLDAMVRKPAGRFPVMADP